MRRLITLLAATVALAAPAPTYAAASWSAGDHPTYQWCDSHRCTRVHRVYRIRCGGWLWLSPRRLFVPPGFQRNPRVRYWCEDTIPSFVSRSGRATL